MLRFTVILSLMGCVELITVKTPQKFVNVTMGQSAHLQCTFVTDEKTTSLTVQWDFAAQSSFTPLQLYYYQSGKEIITEDYEGRLQPPQSPATTFNASITISNMQPADSGVYTCEVHNFPDVDGQSEASVMVTVLEKPSTPYCAVHGDVESGQMVTLTCHSERGNPPPTYTWVKLDQTKTRSSVLDRVTDKGVLQIANISQFEFGEYQCNATNIAGFSTCTIELNDDVDVGVIVGAVIGALLGCTLIAVAVWFIGETIKKKKYKAVNVQPNEMKARAPQAEAAPSSGEAETPGTVQVQVEEQEEEEQPQA